MAGRYVSSRPNRGDIGESCSLSRRMKNGDFAAILLIFIGFGFYDFDSSHESDLMGKLDIEVIPVPEDAL
ncbi:hypothetical protein NL676_018133 [Syzygium grande]|nr:hypothetical protein NL676_018133 [Syzygium grande]